MSIGGRRNTPVQGIRRHDKEVVDANHWNSTPSGSYDAVKEREHNVPRQSTVPTSGRTAEQRNRYIDRQKSPDDRNARYLSRSPIQHMRRRTEVCIHLSLYIITLLGIIRLDFTLIQYCCAC